MSHTFVVNMFVEKRPPPLSSVQFLYDVDVNTLQVWRNGRIVDEYDRINETSIGCGVAKMYLGDRGELDFEEHDWTDDTFVWGNRFCIRGVLDNGTKLPGKRISIPSAYPYVSRLYNWRHMLYNVETSHYFYWSYVDMLLDLPHMEPGLHNTRVSGRWICLTHGDDSKSVHLIHNRAARNLQTLLGVLPLDVVNEVWRVINHNL